MKNFTLIILFSCYLLNSFSQNYSGQIINKKSREPIPFANIGIIGKNVGTVSDVSGLLTIELNKELDNDTLCISCIGYEKRAYLVVDFKKAIENSQQFKIELSPKSYQLDEITIQPIDTKTYTLGNLCDSNSAYGNAFYSNKLGTEMGVIINLPGRKNQAFLKNFRFYVGEFTFDDFPVRLNVYNLINGKPSANILTEPIFFEITSAGEYIIDLTKYNIVTEGDFFISLEYYRIADQKDGKLTFCAVHNRKANKGNGYYRLASQGNWQREMFDNVGFSVQVECEK